MKKLFFFGVFVLAFLGLQAQSPIGVWKSIDDETGEAKSHVQLYQENGKMYGKVIAFLRKNTDPNRVCDKCTDWRKGQKIMQMMIVRDMYLSGDTWKGGKILDPEKGKEYTCTMWFESGKPNELKVRGWIGPLFRTQTWYRVQ
ncbi:MAG: DUF2147 domain-containing protein [Saprospiraceae bacterium]|nr:DUF2147 domain-containing protein [Saprospiraceae bacterium]